MVCTEKNLFLTNGSFLARKWYILIRTFLKFCRMKVANRYMKFPLVIFQEKSSFEAIWSFEPLGHFLLLFDWARSNSARPLLIGSLSSQDMISFMVSTRSLASQNIIRIVIQWKHDFSGKHLCVRYCMDIMRCYCVEVKIHGFVNLLFSKTDGLNF